MNTPIKNLTPAPFRKERIVSSDIVCLGPDGKVDVFDCYMDYRGSYYVEMPEPKIRTISGDNGVTVRFNER